MKTTNRKITSCIFMLLMAIMMVACSSAGTYVGDNGTVTIKDDNTWTATIHYTNAFGESYTERFEGKLDGPTALVITQGNILMDGSFSSVFGYLRGDEIEADGHKYKKR